MTAPHGHISYWQLYRSFLRFLAKKRNVGGGGGEVHPICVLLPKIPNAWVEVWPKDTSLHTPLHTPLRSAVRTSVLTPICTPMRTPMHTPIPTHVSMHERMYT